MRVRATIGLGQLECWVVATACVIPGRGQEPKPREAMSHWLYRVQDDVPVHPEKTSRSEASISIRKIPTRADW